MDKSEEQITDIGILNDAFSRKRSVKIQTSVDIIDLDELKDHQLRKRTEYESYLKRNRLDMGQWIRYALFEVEQRDMRRARSVFERALLVDNTFIPLWIRYIDCELKNKYVNHARNLMDRAITILPRVDKLWYKYLFVEESLENWNIVRSLYNKWTSLEPGTNAWDSFIEFEIRQKEWDDVRTIFARYVTVFPETVQIWFKWIKFESVHGSDEMIRRVYSLAVDTLLSNKEVLSHLDDYESNLLKLIIQFANWEASRQELDRAQTILKLTLDQQLVSSNNPDLQNAMLNLQKKYGNDGDTQNQTILQRRRRHYENLLTKTPRDYDTWWIYLDLIEENFSSQELLTSFDKATAPTTIPQGTPNKNVELDVNWQRYLYLWIRYLIYMELQQNDIVTTRSLYNKVIDQVIPHEPTFIFNKIWIMFAQFEIRQDDIDQARLILGRCIGRTPNKEIFEYYINIEIKLKEFDRARKLYQRYIEYDSLNLDTWYKYIQLEEDLGDEDRARGLFKIILNNEVMDLSLAIRKTVMEKFITFETEMEEYDNGRKLYRNFLDMTNYSVEVWVSFAMYQCSVPTNEQLTELSTQNEDQDDDENEISFEPNEINFNKGREIYEEAISYFKRTNNPENRYDMLKALREFEKRFGNDNTLDIVNKRMPRLEKTKEIQEGGIETEHVEYIFPDDIQTKKGVPSKGVPKFLALANKWKQQQNK